MEDAVRTYRLEAKIGRQWQTICTITAANHREAFGRAMMCLSPELYDKPIRLEVVDEADQRGTD